MMNKEYIIELIEEYILGNITLDELRIALKNDVSKKELSDNIFLQNHIHEALSDKDIRELRVKLDEISNELNKKKKRRPVYIVISAVSIAALLIFGLFLNRQGKTPDEIFNCYYKRYNAGTQMRGSDSLKSDFEFALTEFDKKNFKEAALLFNSIPDTSEYILAKDFYLGMTYMEMNEFTTAKLYLDSVSDHSQSIFIDKALWYKSLCFIKLNEIDNAVSVLNRLQEMDSDYSESARKVIDEIE